MTPSPSLAGQLDALAGRLERPLATGELNAIVAELRALGAGSGDALEYELAYLHDSLWTAYRGNAGESFEEAGESALLSIGYIMGIHGITLPRDIATPAIPQRPNDIRAWHIGYPGAVPALTLVAAPEFVTSEQRANQIADGIRADHGCEVTLTPLYAAPPAFTPASQEQSNG